MTRQLRINANDEQRARSDRRLTVKSQDVVERNATDRWTFSESGMLSVMVVEMNELWKKLIPLLGGFVRESVGPLSQSRLDETFRLAIGPWGVGPGGEVTRVQVAARLFEKLGFVAWAVIGHGSFDGDSEIAKVLKGSSKERCR